MSSDHALDVTGVSACTEAQGEVSCAWQLFFSIDLIKFGCGIRTRL